MLNAHFNYKQEASRMGINSLHLVFSKLEIDASSFHANNLTLMLLFFMQDDEHARHNESNATIASKAEHRAGGQRFAQVHASPAVIGICIRKELKAVQGTLCLHCTLTFLSG